VEVQPGRFQVHLPPPPCRRSALSLVSQGRSSGKATALLLAALPVEGCASSAGNLATAQWATMPQVVFRHSGVEQ
jgi:hypothetical protein